MYIYIYNIQKPVPSQTSRMEFFAKVVDCIQPLTIFRKHSTLGVLQDYEYASDKTKIWGVVINFTKT